MNFQVNTAELRSAATQFEQLGKQSKGFETTAEGMNLSDDQFGRVPGIANRLSEAYQEHRSQCLESMQGCTEAINAVAEGLENTAKQYQELEDAIAEALEQLHKAIQEGQPQ
ncbi:type VII secretion target [Propionibacteriaceae bacterium Y2011]|uniref:type VII secretion target n=1 Tax=Microlunatus sp. Y2014 TaxID=3418488 RepID=UPI003B456CD7